MKNVFFTFLIITLSITASAQYKPIGYIFFEESHKTDTFDMYWIKASHLIYNYRNNIDGNSDEPRRFNAVDSSKYEFVDSLYLKQLDIKPPSWLFDPNINRDFGWYWDTNGNLETGPFRKLYVVEKLEPNKLLGLSHTSVQFLKNNYGRMVWALLTIRSRSVDCIIFLHAKEKGNEIS